MDDEDILEWRIENGSEPYRVNGRFEDLIAWQKARILTADIYRLTRQQIARHDRSLADQLQRAAVSIMSNIAEGYERYSTREYYRYLSLAKGSAGELRAQLYVTFDVGFIDQETFEHYLSQAEEASRVLGSLRAAIGRRLEGNRER